MAIVTDGATRDGGGGGGGQTFPPSGDLSMGTNKLTNLKTPTANADAATKKYVDDADALKAPLASPTFTGTPAAPTAAAGTNTTQIATTAFVKTATTMDYAIAKATSAQSLTGGAWNKLTFDTTVTDSNNLLGTANQFTIQTAGMYTITMFCGFAGNTSCRVQVVICVNGAPDATGSDAITISTTKASRDSAEYWALSCSGSYLFAQNDVVYAYAYVSSNESTSNTGYTRLPYVYFSIVRTA